MGQERFLLVEVSVVDKPPIGKTVGRFTVERTNTNPMIIEFISEKLGIRDGFFVFSDDILNDLKSTPKPESTKPA